MNSITASLRTVPVLFSALLATAVWGQCSPIVVDLHRDGIHLGEAGVGVHFDVNDDGTSDYVQWVRPGGDEAFLSLDRNGNGVVDNGSELFGVGTPLLIDGGTAPNGFVGLAQYDSTVLGGDDDGLITRGDAIWSELRMWNDFNADGISTPPEMLIPESLGLMAFETIPRFRKDYDEAGNILPYWAWATRDARPPKILMVDVFFLVLPERVAMCPMPRSSSGDSSPAGAG